MSLWFYNQGVYQALLWIGEQTAVYSEYLNVQKNLSTKKYEHMKEMWAYKRNISTQKKFEYTTDFFFPKTARNIQTHLDRPIMRDRK